MPERRAQPLRSFSYARSVAPTVWALVALAIAEGLVVHLLVALLWSGAAALVLTLVTVAGVAWLVAFIRSFHRFPVLVEGDRVTLRIGMKRPVEVARAQVAAVRMAFPGAAVKAPGVVNMALLAFPNVLVELREPVPYGRRSRPVRAIAHRLDDPAAFCSALAPQRS